MVFSGYKCPNNMHGYSWNNVILLWFLIIPLRFFLQILFHISFLRGPRQRTCKRRCWDFYFFFFSDLLRALMRPLCIVLFKVLICHRIFLILRKFFALWDLATICFDAIKIFAFFVKPF